MTSGRLRTPLILSLGIHGTLVILISLVIPWNFNLESPRIPEKISLKFQQNAQKKSQESRIEPLPDLGSPSFSSPGLTPNPWQEIQPNTSKKDITSLDFENPWDIPEPVPDPGFSPQESTPAETTSIGLSTGDEMAIQTRPASLPRINPKDIPGGLLELDLVFHISKYGGFPEKIENLSTGNSQLDRSLLAYFSSFFFFPSATGNDYSKRINFKIQVTKP